MKNLTMQQLEDLGFEVVKCYSHDNFITQRRKKGCITIETTWDKLQDYQQVSQDLNINETYLDSFTFYQLYILDLLLNK